MGAVETTPVRGGYNLTPYSSCTNGREPATPSSPVWWRANVPSPSILGPINTPISLVSGTIYMPLSTTYDIGAKTNCTCTGSYLQGKDSENTCTIMSRTAQREI